MKTVLGYHDKQKEKYQTLENKLPLLVHDRYEPFVMTTSEFYTVNTVKVIQNSKAYPVRRFIHNLKNTVATILLIPGILTAVFYIYQFSSAMSSTDNPETLIPQWLTNFTFWIAMWGAMILWHETYKTFHQETKIGERTVFSEHDLKAIKGGKLGIAKRVLKDGLEVLDHESQALVYSAISKNELDTADLFNDLLAHQNCQTVLRRLDLLNDKDITALEKIVTPKLFPALEVTMVRSLIIYSIDEAILSNSSVVRPEHILIAFFKVFPSLINYLRKRKLNVNLMRSVAMWIQMRESQRQATQILNPNVPYYRTGGIATSWIYGYTFVLSHFSTDLTQEMAKKGGRYGIGHDAEMEEVLSILSKVSKNNVLLIGESGTGKSSLAKGIAERINKRQVPSHLRNMRIIQLDINGLVAAAPKYGSMEEAIKQTMEELQKAGNTVLFIDEIQEIVGVHGKESQHSLAGMILPYVLDSKFPIIGTITYADYKKFFYARESLRQSFQNVEIKEVTPQAAFEIILTRLDELERIYSLKMMFPAILSAVELAQRYIFERKLPDSAVGIIESSCAAAQRANEKVLRPELVADTVSQMTEIPVQDVSTEEATKLLDLEEKIRTKVIGQDEAVHQVVEALKRARTGIRDPNKPIGSFLFLGPTGVGKTHLAKTVGFEYFGDKHKMIRLDMSEFKDVSSVSRMLGTAASSELAREGVTFLDEVKMHPFSVVLLDELEKAHPQILDLFLQVLDDGRMTNANGETISFDNTIIIATSNIGSKTLLEALEKDKAMFKEAKERVMLELRSAVRVEFLNRFDRIIVFSPHSMENLEKIAVLLLEELRTRMHGKEITVEWDDEVAGAIARGSYNPGLGARPMRRYIQEKVESVVAQKMLEGAVKPGDTFALTAEMLKGSV